MSDNPIADADARRIVKPRRIDGPHSVGALKFEHSQALVLELAGVGSTTEDRAESLDFSRESASPLEGLLELEESMAAREEQLENQAGQLADHLQEQLRELEYREALQNARSAELDNEFRRARLWITEKVAELTERENGVAAAEARSCEFEDRQAGLISSEQALGPRQQTFDEREAALTERERQFEAKENLIRERRQSIEREAAALHHARQEWERSQEDERADLANERANIRQELEAALQAREEVLSQGECLLTKHSGELEKDRQALARERVDWQRQQTTDREASALHRYRAGAELEQRRTRLATRETTIDQQQAAFDQLRAEITAAHRQSIEMRLIAEQLWAQVQGRMPPAEITQSIVQLRLKLGEQYRLEQQGLAEQKQELHALAEKFAEQSAALRSQRKELQTWFAAREEEVERQADLLVTRGRELLVQSDQFRDLKDQWTSDRRHLEQELRGMHTRLRQAAA